MNTVETMPEEPTFGQITSVAGLSGFGASIKKSTREADGSWTLRDKHGQFLVSISKESYVQEIEKRMARQKRELEQRTEADSLTAEAEERKRPLRERAKKMNTGRRTGERYRPKMV